MREVSELTKALRPASPSLAIIGGAKFSTKEPVLTTLLKSYDRVFVGGALANDFMQASGKTVGKSLVSSAVDELATALTYWAATWKPIVLDPPGSGPADRPPLEVLAALPRVPESARSGPILGIADAALALDGLVEDIGRASLPTGHDAAFDLLVQAGARLFLADGGRHPHAIAHAVTLPAAARELSALLDDDATDALVRRTWVAVALLASTVGSGIADGVPMVTRTLSEQVSSAVETGDAHAIKLAEACVREAARQPDATDLLTSTCAAGAVHLGDF